MMNTLLDSLIKEKSFREILTSLMEAFFISYGEKGDNTCDTSSDIDSIPDNVVEIPDIDIEAFRNRCDDIAAAVYDEMESPDCDIETLLAILHTMIRMGFVWRNLNTAKHELLPARKHLMRLGIPISMRNRYLRSEDFIALVTDKSDRVTFDDLKKLGI